VTKVFVNWRVEDRRDRRVFGGSDSFELVLLRTWLAASWSSFNSFMILLLLSIALAAINYTVLTRRKNRCLGKVFNDKELLMAHAFDEVRHS